ncbi:MAG: ribonuclease III [Clostridiales bacterium]|jgi:ribonuclease-3|nr:ribonuclease III [Eubacteriales bacterium]MDH7565088.1 ribonuclease III [Clostridiales bacterium]
MHNNLNHLLSSINEYERAIGYTFKDKNNAILALTHSSYANENRHEKLTSNERLEFLGDAVLNIIISESIYKRYSGLDEGEMTKIRANIVCEASLVQCANKIELGKYLLLGKGEEMTGGRNRISILSDAFEALIGAIYLDGGMKSARKFIHSQMKQLLEDSLKGNIFMDYKSQLQEYVQKDGEKKITYEIIEQKGPDHNKVFVSQVKIVDKVMGQGEGKSKKEAEQNAAKSAIGKFN